MGVELLSIEVTNRCRKACAFCYNRSHAAGTTTWTVDDIVHLVTDMVPHGLRSVSLGGGEPMEFDGLHDVLARLDGVLHRSVTTHGLLLDRAGADALVRSRPDKVHVSIHDPSLPSEVERVIHQVHMLSGRGIRSGVNLLVRASAVDDAVRAAAAIRASGIGGERMVLLPMRGTDTPTPADLARVADSRHFQSMSCLLACGPSPRFVSLGWDRSVAWCSYTSSRAPLRSPDHAGLQEALRPLGLQWCGGHDEPPIRLARSAQHGHDVVRGG